ncbi:unnamed protein product [Triticum turgidum subsp. durum]|uniref:Uncharacterized protein n=1 Tax=Triticum turgidum subsp. durum TaxID=4567 RepID=A0A9R0ZHG7_TRITD|nr:unnamed protein product [Triticum turgidum subsp. durum]
MALAPRSSLRSLVLLMSHGKPRLSSFFSSSSAAGTGVPPATPGADAPAVQPPVTPLCFAAPSGPKLPVEEEFVLHPIPGVLRPRPCPHPPGAVEDVTDKACLNAPEDPSSAPDQGSSSTPEPVSDKPPWDISEDPGHPVLDPPPPRPPRRGRRAVTDEPARCAQEHPKYPVPDCSSDKVFSYCSSAVPPPAPGTCTPAAPDVQPPVTPALPDRSGHKLPDHEELVVHPLPDPSGNRLSPVIEEPARCTLDNPKYPTPGSSSHKLPAHEELVIHPLPGGPRPRPRPRPRGAVKDVTDKACLNAPEDPTYPTPDHGSSSPSVDLLEDPLHPVRDPPGRP